MSENIFSTLKLDWYFGWVRMKVSRLFLLIIMKASNVIVSSLKAINLLFLCPWPCFFAPSESFQHLYSQYHKALQIFPWLWVFLFLKWLFCFGLSCLSCIISYIIFVFHFLCLIPIRMKCLIFGSCVLILHLYIFISRLFSFLGYFFDFISKLSLDFFNLI